MGYTMSLDVSCKVSRAEVRGYLQHTARDVDRVNGVEVRHSNEDIDTSRTDRNITKVLMPDGTYQQCTDSSQLVEALERRLRDVKKPLRKDAVVLRPVLLQLDPAWYRDNQDESARKGSYNKMLKWAQDEYGRNNMIGFSVHLDESNPHLHILVTPVTDDGRLSQKDWYSGPAALREMHQELREHMRSEGFDVDLQRRKPGKHAKRMSEREYKDYAELQRERQELQEQQKGLQEREVAVRRREMAVEQRERDVEQREGALEAQEAAVAKKGEELGAAVKMAVKTHEMAERHTKALITWGRNKGYDSAVASMQAYSQERKESMSELRAKVVSLRDTSDMVIRGADGQSECGLER